MCGGRGITFSTSTNTFQLSCAGSIPGINFAGWIQIIIVHMWGQPHLGSPSAEAGSIFYSLLLLPLTQVHLNKHGNWGIHCLPQWLTAVPQRLLSPELSAKQDISPHLGLPFPSSCSWLKALDFTLRSSWCNSSTLGKPKTTPKAGGTDTGNHLDPSSRRKSIESTDRRSTVCWKFFSTGQLGKLCTWKK